MLDILDRRGSAEGGDELPHLRTTIADLERNPPSIRHGVINVRAEHQIELSSELILTHEIRRSPRGCSTEQARIPAHGESLVDESRLAIAAHHRMREFVSVDRFICKQRE